jgi:hypothetical protein
MGACGVPIDVPEEALDVNVFDEVEVRILGGLVASTICVGAREGTAAGSGPGVRGGAVKAGPSGPPGGEALRAPDG